MSTLTEFVTSPDTVPLVFAEVVLLAPWFFDGIVKRTVKIDDQTIHQAGEHVVFMYCEDMVWRVGLLLSVVTSILTILAILTVQVTTQKLAPWAGVILIIILLGTILLLLAKRNPFEMSDPLVGRWGWFNGYLAGTAGVFVLNAAIIVLNYWKFVPTTCPP